MTRQDLLQKNDDDVVICATVRTAFTKVSKGALKDTCVEELLAPVLAEVADRAKLPSKDLVEEIAFGVHVPPGCGNVVTRMSMLSAGYPVETGHFTVNRQCLAGFQAISTIANNIKAGDISIGIAAAAESLSTGRGLVGSFPEAMSEKVKEHSIAAECLFTPGQTSDNVAKEFNITRDEVDALSAASYQKASAAQKAGKFKEEILPIKVNWKDPMTQESKEVVAEIDDVIRHDVTTESLGKLKALFSEEGPTTAGNSSPLADGAAAMVLARRSEAIRLGLPILAKYVRTSSIGCAPRIMGIAPSVVIPKSLKQNGIAMEDIDMFEIVEGFSAGNAYTIKKLNLPVEKMNPNGGSFAMGHPLSATPIRIVGSSLIEAKRTGARFILAAGCGYAGAGTATLYINEQ